MMKNKLLIIFNLQPRHNLFSITLLKTFLFFFFQIADFTVCHLHNCLFCNVKVSLKVIHISNSLKIGNVDQLTLVRPKKRICRFHFSNIEVMFGFLGFLLNINLYVDFDFFAHFFRLTSLDKQSPREKEELLLQKLD